MSMNLVGTSSSHETEYINQTHHEHTTTTPWTTTSKHPPVFLTDSSSELDSDFLNFFLLTLLSAAYKY